MKYSLIVLVLISSHWFALHAQSPDNFGLGMVSYERVLSFDGKPSSTPFTLVFNSDFSLFLETKNSSEEGIIVKPSSDDEFDFTLALTLSGKRYMVLTDFERDSIESQLTLLDGGKQRTYIVQEKMQHVRWKIENEFRMIDKVKAQKATGEFRGRIYVAWFSSEIPVKYGPWKLNGLPGLILSVEDETHEVMFRVTSIKVPFAGESLSKDEFSFSREAEKISLARFRQIEAKQGDELQRLIASKLPRGAKMKASNITSRTIELEYEE